MNKLVIILVLPLMGIAGLIAQTEFMLRQGKTFRVTVEGYDPRDILKGHYLNFRFRWNFDLPKTTAYAEKFRKRYSQEDLLCVNSAGEGYSSWPVEEDNTNDCEFVVKGSFRIVGENQDFEFITGLEQFYIPEEHGKLLEKLILEKPSEMEIQLNQHRKPLLKELYIDRRPWREHLP